MAHVLAELAQVLLADNRPAEAEPVSRECLEIRAKILAGKPAHHFAKALLGRALAGQGKHAEAVPLLLEACEKLQPSADYKDYKQDQAEIMTCLVRAYEDLKDEPNAARWRQRLQELQAKDR